MFALFYKALKKCFSRGEKKSKLLVLAIFASPITCFVISLLITSAIILVVVPNYEMYEDIFYNNPIMLPLESSIYLGLIVSFAALTKRKLRVASLSPVLFIYSIYNTVIISHAF